MQKCSNRAPAEPAFCRRTTLLPPPPPRHRNGTCLRNAYAHPSSLPHFFPTPRHRGRCLGINPSRCWQQLRERRSAVNKAAHKGLSVEVRPALGESLLRGGAGAALWSGGESLSGSRGVTIITISMQPGMIGGVSGRAAAGRGERQRLDLRVREERKQQQQRLFFSFFFFFFSSQDRKSNGFGKRSSSRVRTAGLFATSAAAFCFESVYFGR